MSSGRVARMESLEILPGESVSKDVGSSRYVTGGDHKGTLGADEEELPYE